MKRSPTPAEKQWLIALAEAKAVCISGPASPSQNPDFAECIRQGWILERRVYTLTTVGVQEART